MFMSKQVLTNLERDTIGEILNISMGSAATAVSTLLDSKVIITTPNVSVVDIEEFSFKSLEPAIGVQINYTSGIAGDNVMILKEQDIKMILGKLMFMDPAEIHELDEMATSAVSEIMNQMMGSAATALAQFLGRTIDISTPEIIDVKNAAEFTEKMLAGRDQIVAVTFNLSIDGIMSSEFMNVMGLDFVREILDAVLPPDMQEEPAPAQTASPPPPPPPPPPPAAPQAPPPQHAQDAGMQAPYPQQYGMPYPPQNGAPYPPYQNPYPPYPQQGYYAPPPAPPPPAAPPAQAAPPVNVHRYSYESIPDADGAASGSNLDLVLSVPLQVTVELGRTKKKIKEIIELGQGSIVELDKQAGAQVDVMVNGQLIARGDVVVVDDNFSVRITEILQNRDLINYM